MARPQFPPPPKTLRQRVKSVLLGGEKGCGLPEYGLGYPYGVGKCTKSQKLRVHGRGKGVQKQENPVARLKLLLVRFVSFLGMGLIYMAYFVKYRSLRS